MLVKDRLIEMLRNHQRTKCHFFQNKHCMLHKYICFFCSHYTRHIEGMDQIRDYLVYVGNRKTATRALFFATASLIIAILALLKELIVIYLKY